MSNARVMGSMTGQGAEHGLHGVDFGTMAQQWQQRIGMGMLAVSVVIQVSVNQPRSLVGAQLVVAAFWAVLVLTLWWAQGRADILARRWQAKDDDTVLITHAGCFALPSLAKAVERATGRPAGALCVAVSEGLSLLTGLLSFMLLPLMLMCVLGMYGHPLASVQALAMWAVGGHLLSWAASWGQATDGSFTRLLRALVLPTAAAAALALLASWLPWLV